MYNTTNLYVAASLSAYGAELIETVNDEGTVVFRFRDTTGSISALARTYHKKNFPHVQPSDFVDHLMAIRDRLSAAR